MASTLRFSLNPAFLFWNVKSNKIRARRCFACTSVVQGLISVQSGQALPGVDDGDA